MANHGPLTLLTKEYSIKETGVDCGQMGFLKCWQDGSKSFIQQHLGTDYFINPDEEVVL